MDISNPIFQNEDSAREYLEAARWPDGPFCPHCGEAEQVTKLKGKSHRPGLYQCKSCREQFTVTVGTVFERSKVPLHKWLLATHLMTGSKKGISAHQIHRTIGVTYKTAWFMCHRIREAMREKKPDMMGGGGHYVEADETYWGNKRKPRYGYEHVHGYQHKEKILTLVERDGKARSFHIPTVNAKVVGMAIREHLKPDSALITDSAAHYKKVGKSFAGHGAVNHEIGEYVRGSVHTNTVENYFSILKRGLNGVYQHVSPRHLKRYVGEFDFRYSYRQKLGYDDSDRALLALKGIEGKRLTYKRPIDERF